MAVNRRQRRRSGSLGSLKSALWSAIIYNLDVIENAELGHDVKQRACNSLTQAALAFSRVTELHEVERGLHRLTDQLQNGHP